MDVLHLRAFLSRAPDAALWYLGTAVLLLLLGWGDGARWPRKASPMAARLFSAIILNCAAHAGFG